MLLQLIFFIVLFFGQSNFCESGGKADFSERVEGLIEARILQLEEQYGKEKCRDGHQGFMNEAENLLNSHKESGDDFLNVWNNFVFFLKQHEPMSIECFSLLAVSDMEISLLWLGRSILAIELRDGNVADMLSDYNEFPTLKKRLFELFSQPHYMAKVEQFTSTWEALKQDDFDWKKLQNLLVDNLELIEISWIMTIFARSQLSRDLEMVLKSDILAIKKP